MDKKVIATVILAIGGYIVARHLLVDRPKQERQNSMSNASGDRTMMRDAYLKGEHKF